MTAHLTLPSVTAALVAAGVQTVVSVDEEPTMACPELGHGNVLWHGCDTCGGSGRVPLSGDVEIRADGDVREGDEDMSGEWTVNDLATWRPGLPDWHLCRPSEEIPIVLDAPVARATVQSVPVVQWRNRISQSTTYLTFDPASRLRVRVIDRGLSIGWWEDFTPQLPFLDLDAPWALILSDVRPVEDR